MNVVHEISSYATELEEHISRQSLPWDWFDKPDHIAFKAANTSHFDALIKQIRKGSLGPGVDEIVRTNMDGRRIDVAFLAGPLVVGDLWEVNLVEIMEPRPEKAGKDKVGLDHMEFFHLSLGLIEKHFLDRGVIPNFEPKPYHNTLCVQFGTSNRELKFTDNPLREVIKAELAADVATVQ